LRWRSVGLPWLRAAPPVQAEAGPVVVPDLDLPVPEQALVREPGLVQAPERVLEQGQRVRRARA